MIDDLIRERVKKLDDLRRRGYHPYPARVKRTAPIAEILNRFNVLAKSRKIVAVTGRVMGFRNQGNLFFVDLRDESGALQLVAKMDKISDFDVFRDHLDIGDFLQASGSLFKTKRGERSVQIRALRFLAKSLRPLPSQWHGLEDQEVRFRKRYLDLIANPNVKELFVKKSQFWQEARQFFLNAGFTEVETPILEAVPGGADAEPFITHHNALDTDFSLRISLEIALKKLVVGGFEKIFEIGRIFRNEGIDQEHLQDYTQLEFYWAYADYRDLMKFVEKLYKRLVRVATGSLKTKWGEKTIEWNKKWPLIDYYEVFKRYVGIDLSRATRDDLFVHAGKKNLKPEMHFGRGRLIDLLFKKFVRPTFIQPSFLIDPPLDVEPLAKRTENDPNRVERFQVVACATELGKGFSELNDPIDQRARFKEQMKLREEGDTEAQRLDEDFLEALEYGMPPTAGFGVSERLFAVVIDKPVRELVFFPPMRTKK